MSSAAEPRATGRCLCGAVSYTVRGALRDVILCHCEECARWGGYIGAFSAARAEDVEIGGDDALRWIDSPRSDRGARRGFCRTCGSSLFWQPDDRERIHIAAGTLDRPTGLRITGHWYTRHAGDFDELPDDGLPRDDELAAGKVRWS